MRGEYNPPVIIEREPGAGARLMLPMEDKHGGMANALYVFHERRESSGKWLWKLERIDEWLPPLPPQLQTVDDSRRLPMMEDGAFSVRLEALQREREWAEHDSRGVALNG